MDDHDGLVEPLLRGLAETERQQILELMHRARADQLHRKRHPPTRPRKNLDGLPTAVEGPG